MSPGDDHTAHKHQHGSLGGHVLPGSFFLIWATWWFANIVSIQIHRAQHRKEFTSRSYYHSTYLSKLPLEPLAKLVLPFIGILGELWLSHGKWRYEPTTAKLHTAIVVTWGSRTHWHAALYIASSHVSAPNVHVLSAHTNADPADVLQSRSYL